MDNNAITVIVIDQFVGPGEAYLRTHDLTLADVLPGGSHYERWSRKSWNGAVAGPRVIELDQASVNTFTPPWATTVLRVNARGLLEFWLARWDSS
ncbi:MAG: hypothetical protein ABL982_00175 [Vicinamibacterales bacterium]